MIPRQKNIPSQRAVPHLAQRVQHLLQEALHHHRASRLSHAEQLYRQILAIDRQHSDSLHLLGLIADGTNRHDVAIALIERAVAINARVPVYHFSLGNVLSAQGHIDDAIGCYQRALNLAPGFADACNNLGNALTRRARLSEATTYYRRALDLQPDHPDAGGNLANALMHQGQLDEAIVCYQRALAHKPDRPDILNNLGIALRRTGQYEDAITCFRRALNLEPHFPAAQNNLGNALEHQGRAAEAIACYRRALELQSDYADAHNNLGNLLARLGCQDEAVISFRAALALEPDHAPAYSNLGNALRTLGRVDEAAACLRRALDLKPDFEEAQYNIGNVQRDLGQLDAAVASFQQALHIRPDFIDAHINLGNTLAQQRRLDDAVACYQRALTLAPDVPDAHFNLGLVLLALGDLPAGWREYEWRWKITRMVNVRREFPQPQWCGEAARGQTLLVHAEQGFGDTLQFCRYGALAVAQGLRVIFEVPRPLVRLLRGLAGIAQVVACGDDLPPFDLHCPMLSLPLALGTTLATIPGGVPYLVADTAQVAAWQSRLAAQTQPGIKVGFVWAGDSRSGSPDLAAVDHRRSIMPQALRPLLGLERVHGFSLQKSGPPTPVDLPLTDFMNEMQDFADTAALIANLDLVISVDTAVAHLAGALGKPVWLLDRFDSCWRWLTDRRDSPWYPTVRIYRQSRAGDWDSVIAEMARDLHRLSHS